MVWTDLSSAFTFNSQLTSAQQRALRDNITAMANGEAGAPRIQPEAMRAHPKSLQSCIYAGMSMVPNVTTSYSAQILMYKTSTDNLLYARVFGIPYASNSIFPLGIVQVILEVICNGAVYGESAGYFYAPSTNAVADWYHIPVFDLKNVPDYNFYTVRFRYCPLNPWGNQNHRWFFELHTCAFYTEPYPEATE